MKNSQQKCSEISNEIKSRGGMLGIHEMITWNPILTGFLFLFMIQNIQPDLAKLTPCPDLYPHFIGYIKV